MIGHIVGPKPHPLTTSGSSPTTWGLLWPTRPVQTCSLGDPPDLLASGRLAFDWKAFLFFTFYSIGFIEKSISHHIPCLHHALFVEILFCSVRMFLVSPILLFVAFSNLIEGSCSIRLLIIYKSGVKSGKVSSYTDKQRYETKQKKYIKFPCAMTW